MPSISNRTVCRLQIQGFSGSTPQQLAEYRFGIRFAYLACGTIAILGLAFVNIPTLAFLAVVALLGVLLPNHPFDYIYNYGIRHIAKRPPIPNRTAQIKFACAVATVWLVVTVILFNFHYVFFGRLWGSLLVASALLVGSTDICIPSMIYNLTTKRKINPFQQPATDTSTTEG